MSYKLGLSTYNADMDWTQFWHSFWLVLTIKVGVVAIAGLVGAAVPAYRLAVEQAWETLYRRYWKRKGFTVEPPQRR
jgi:cell shape-determining protein MreD